MMGLQCDHLTLDLGNPKIYNASIVVCELQLLPYPWGNVFGKLTLFHLFDNPQAPVAKFFFW